MPNSYYIDREKRTIFLTFEDELSIDQQIHLHDRLYLDPNYQKGYNFFSDFSKASPSFDVDIHTIEKGANFIDQYEKTMGECRWAMFTPQDYSYTLACIFKKLLKSSIIKVEIFRDKEKAEQWLGI